ncbi:MULTISPECIES: hypothetical protein [Mesorhizobium]|uniref:hypothetical protein n=1 Tax=Mesorhizobium australicum TaxID=536018 RepID=UPI003335A6CD
MPEGQHEFWLDGIITSRPGRSIFLQPGVPHTFWWWGTGRGEPHARETRRIERFFLGVAGSLTIAAVMPAFYEAEALHGLELVGRAPWNSLSLLQMPGQVILCCGLSAFEFQLMNIAAKGKHLCACIEGILSWRNSIRSWAWNVGTAFPENLRSAERGAGCAWAAGCGRAHHAGYVR